MPLSKWMRIAMLATAVMNILGSTIFMPTARAIRAMVGLPADAPAIYLAMTGIFIFIFGCAYLWSGLTGRADQLFISVAAAGKLSFFGLLVWYWTAGILPGTVPMLGVGDLVFGCLFLVWLYQSRFVVRDTHLVVYRQNR